jgi:hypothetical protein
MQRVVGVSGLALGAILLAGCGSSSLQAKAGKIVGTRTPLLPDQPAG